MACPIPFPTSVNHRPHHHTPPRKYNCAAAKTNNPINFCSSFSSTINLHRSFPFNRNSWSLRCHASSPRPEPPSNDHPPPSSGVTAPLARFQDALQIFFAVLFWMSLFFWSCVWDGGNNGRRPNKGSWCRK